MNRNVPIIAALAVVMAAVPASQAQEPAIQNSIQVVMEESGSARVTHILKSGGTAYLELIPGTAHDMSVTDEAGNRILHEDVSPGVILVSPSETDVTVAYTIRDAMALNGTVWTWNFLYLHSTIFDFPPGLETVYVNERPVHLDGNRIRCHGCQMKLEYSLEEPQTSYPVTWEEHRFALAIRTHDTIRSVAFDQPTKSLGFNVSGGHFVTVIVPSGLLGDPYQVYLGDEKMWFHEYRNNGTHSWINIRPDVAGAITLVGTTVIPEFPAAAVTLAAALAIPWFSLRMIRTSKNRTRLSKSRTGDTLWRYS